MSPLVQALEPHAYSMERPPGRVAFELNAHASPTDPEPLILEFVRIVKGLPAEPRGLWDRASNRVFDIGIQSGHRPIQEAYHLACSTLREVGEVGANIGITVYAADPKDCVREAG